MQTGQQGFDDNYIGLSWGTVFDDNGPDPGFWSWSGGSLNTSVTSNTSARVTSAEAKTGTNSLALGEPFPEYSGVIQTLSTAQGLNTTVSFWLKWVPNGQTLGAEENSIQVKAGGALRVCLENEYPTSWKQYTFVYVAQMNADDIEIWASVR